MIYYQTTAFEKLWKLTKRIRGVAGGTSASKTISILEWLLWYAQTYDKKVVSVCSETFPHLERGAMRDFLDIIKSHKLYKDSAWNKTNHIYTFETGSIIEFFSVDQPDKVRGPRRDVLFINEANRVPFETYEQLEIRTNDVIWLDWNPVSDFWFYSEVNGKDDVDFQILTYRDNEMLNDALVKSIESRREKKNWWRIYGEGLLGEAEGRIYKGWQLIDDIPFEARLYRYGLDFGYTNDPTAIVAIYEYNGGYIFDEVCYRKGLSNKDIADLLKNLDEKMVKADSAEPKSIDEIALYGISIIGATKGKDSVLHGIQKVQDLKVSVTKRSTNLWKEYQNYLWEVDKDGHVLNEPQDFLNHCMDAIRYGLEDNRPSFDDSDWEVLRLKNQRLLSQRGY